MAFKRTQYRGLVNSSLRKFAPDSLRQAKEFVNTTWGNRVPEPLLQEWAELWWRREHEPAPTSTQEPKVIPKRDITLNDLKVADQFDALMKRLNLDTDDVRGIIECVRTLGGVDFAMEVVEELRVLRGSPRAVEPSLFASDVFDRFQSD